MVELNAVVSQRVEITPYTIILRIIPDGWDLPEFTPGQFTILGLPGSTGRYRFSNPEEPPADPDKFIRRAYSIASSSIEHEYIEFYITLVRSGTLTPRLFSLGVGDRIFLSPKFTGIFTLSEIPDESNLILIATGTGLAPYMSMVRTELGSSKKRRYAVLHGAANSWDLGYRSELITMGRICPEFNYIPIISRPDDEPTKWNGPVGYMQDLWNGENFNEEIGFTPTPADTHTFLCGNPTMIETMLGLLEEVGFKEHKKNVPGNVHLERYW